MSFIILHGYKDTRLVQQLRDLNHELCLVDLNSTDPHKLFDVLPSLDADVIVYVDSMVTKLADGWLNEILEPMSSPSIKLSYCDFVSNGVPIFHTTLPSHIGIMPLCAFRKDVIKTPSPTILQDMVGNVMSRYIPKFLVEIDDPSQQ